MQSLTNVKQRNSRLGSKPVRVSEFRTDEYRLQGPLAQIQHQLTEFSGSDRHAESEINKGSALAGSGCLAAFFGIPATFMAFPYGLILLIPGLIVFFTGTNRVNRNQPFDLENHRYELPLQLLDLIAADLDPRKPIDLRVDFRPSEKAPYLVGNRFAHPWLAMTACTVDGFRLRLELTRKGSTKSVSKRKGTKTKTRYQDQVRLSVSPPRGTQVSVPAGTALQPPVQLNLTRFQGTVSERGASLQALGPQALRVSYRGTRNSGSQLTQNDLGVLLVTCFRGLLKAD